MAIYLFLTGRGTGVPTDFSQHKLVGIGHSMGAISLLLTHTYPDPPKWHSIILVEPMVFSREADETFRDNFLEKGAMARRDIWPSKEDAYKIFSERKGFKTWDDRVLRIYCVSSALSG